MPLSILSPEQLLRLPPMIIGTIRWKISIGGPTGDASEAFDVKVEEHTATEYRDAGGGNIIPEPGTGIFKLVSNSVSCRMRSDEGDDHMIGFQVTGLHYNMPFDGFYRTTPRLRVKWRPSGIFALGYYVIEPISANVVLTRDHPIQSCEFEVVHRSWFSGRRL